MAERHEDSIFDALKKNDPKYIADRYQTSKLLEVLFVRALAEKMNTGPHASERVILNMVNPGLCHSSLMRNTKGIMGLIVQLLKLILARSTELGSRTLVTSAAGGSETHGKYMSDCEVKDPSEFVRSEDGKKTQERVYKELMAILEKIQPGITKNI
jgi:NAD(P)-dependent dehydrogenase (short-subunit alcohol dehydrogenase family)